MTDPRPGAPPRHVSLLALPEAVVSTLAGLYDVMNARATLGAVDARAVAPTFRVQVVGESAGPLRLASGVPFEVQCAVDDIAATDIVIVPSVLLPPHGWRPGRYPRLVAWLRRMHDGGAVLCSACSGIFLLAETGRFDGRDVTVHFAYADLLASAHPALTVHPDRVLVIAGDHDDLICSGASTTWHDLVLYLIARYAGATDAQEVARMYALQWHQDGLTPFITFQGRHDHCDAEVAALQRWLATHFAVASPVDEMIRRSSLAERTLKRRFATATGLTPIAYVQRLRIEDAKRRLERTDAPVDEVSWRVGYEDAAFFRRLFKRITGLAPGAYRKRFAVPAFARR